MKKKLQQLSVNTYTLILLGIILLFFLALILFQNQSALSLLLQHIYHNTQDTAVMYQKQIDYELDRVETYLYTVAFENADYTTLSSQDSSSTSWHSSLHRLNQNFTNALSLYVANGFLFYTPETDNFLLSLQIVPSDLTLRNALRDVISSDELPPDWEIIEIDDSYYLIRLVAIGKSRLGVLVSVSSLLESVTSSRAEDISLYLTTADNCLIGLDGTALYLDFEILTDSYAIKKINGQKMLIVQQALSNDGFYLTGCTGIKHIPAQISHPCHHPFPGYQSDVDTSCQQAAHPPGKYPDKCPVKSFRGQSGKSDHCFRPITGISTDV